MIKNIIISLAFLILHSLQVFSEESGWSDFDYYKTQKLKINGLSLISISDNNKFYSYHNDNMIRVWDLSSGILVDSIDLTFKPYYINFSKDGHYAIYVNNFELYILELTNKKLIKKEINLRDLVYLSDNCSEFNFEFDYDEKLNIFFLKLNYREFTYSSYICSYRKGYFNIYEISQDSIILLKKISSSWVNNFAYSNKEIFFTYLHYELCVKSQGRPDSYSKREYGIQHYSLEKDTLEFFYQNFIDNDFQDYRDYFSNIYYDTLKGDVIIKYNLNSENKIHYIDYFSGINKMTISNKAKSCNYNQKFSLLYLLEDFDISIYTDESSIPIKTLALPIKADEFTVNSFNYIIVYNNIGDMVFLYNLPSSILLNNGLNFLISPNPASDYIEINYNVETGLRPISTDEMKIYNILGECVVSTPALRATPQEGNFRIDISNLPNGLYYVKIGNIINKFMVVR